MADYGKFEVTFDAEDVLGKLKNISKEVDDAARLSMQDCVDELVRISSEITPLDKGILQRSHAKVVSGERGVYVGTVSFAVKEKYGKGKHFNYALLRHEATYKLGEGSLKRPGTSGWSGKAYSVGNKYLERPLKGESEAFLKHMATEIKKAIGI